MYETIVLCNNVNGILVTSFITNLNQVNFPKNEENNQKKLDAWNHLQNGLIRIKNEP